MNGFGGGWEPSPYAMGGFGGTGWGAQAQAQPVNLEQFSAQVNEEVRAQVAASSAILAQNFAALQSQMESLARMIGAITPNTTTPEPQANPKPPPPPPPQDPAVPITITPPPMQQPSRSRKPLEWPHVFEGNRKQYKGWAYAMRQKILVDRDLFSDGSNVSIWYQINARLSVKSQALVKSPFPRAVWLIFTCQPPVRQFEGTSHTLAHSTGIN
jgi:hypothetical protein